MKKLILIAGFTGILVGCNNDTFTSGTTNPLINPDYNYEIDTWGSNSEVYEFTPKSNSKKSCVFVMLDSGSAMGLQCFDKQKAG